MSGFGEDFGCTGKTCFSKVHEMNYTINHVSRVTYFFRKVSECCGVDVLLRLLWLYSPCQKFVFT